MSTTRIALRLTRDEFADATALGKRLVIDRNTLIRLGLKRILTRPPTKKEVEGVKLPVGLAAAEPGQGAINAGKRRENKPEK